MASLLYYAFLNTVEKIYSDKLLNKAGIHSIIYKNDLNIVEY